MKRLAGYLRRYRARYAAGVACLLVTASLAMAVPYLLKRAIDAIEHGAPFDEVARFALIIVAIALVQAVVRTLSRSLIFNVGRDVEHDLRGDLFAHLERLPVAYYQQQQTGDLMSRLINDAATSVEDQVGERYGAFARTAADTVAGFASQLREKDVEEIIDDARDFVRKSPVVAIGAAAAIGFVLARLVRAGVEANAASATDATSRSGSTTTGKRSGAA